jgi:photosystem II stability/assembly factor-like uncharacterized protein
MDSAHSLEATLKSPSKFFLFMLLALLLLLSTTLPARSQDGTFEDSFDNPDLPGWQHSPKAYVENGILRVEPGGFASPEGQWEPFEMVMRARYTGFGELAILYNMNEAGVSILLFNGSRFQLQRETGGQVMNIGEPALFEVAEGEWFNLRLWVGEAEVHVLIEEKPVFSRQTMDDYASGGFGFEAVGDMVFEIDHFLLFPHEAAPPERDAAPEVTKSTPSEPETVDPSSLTWIRLGGPPGGLGYDIRYSFDDHDTWYVTDANAGVHISTDDGLTWHQSNTGIDTAGGASGDAVPIFSLTVDPHNPQIIWAGTDMNGRIYKSVDGGRTWESKDRGVIHEHEILLSFRGFTVDPRSSDIVFAMGELQRPGNNVWGLGVGGVVYKTTNGGESWTRIWHGPIPSSLTRYMWIHPEDPEILYVSTGIFDRGAVGEGNHTTETDPFGGLGILKSTDGGQSWEILGKENGLDFLYVGSLYMHPDDPDILLAATGHIADDPALIQWASDRRSPMGVYRTSDGGETWMQVLTPRQEAIGQAFSAVEMCPSDPDIVYAGSDAAVYRSEDGGLTWEKVTGGDGGWGPIGVRAGWPIDMQCDPDDTDRVFANNYSGGNFLSEDGGRTWINASTGYSGAQAIHVAVDPFNPARVFAVGRSGGWYSEDGGLTWNGIHNPGEALALAGGEVGGVAIDPSRPNHILIGTGETILKWNSEQSTWQSIFYPLNYGPETAIIEFAPSDTNIVYAGSANHNTMVHGESYEAGRGVILSRDGGTTWELITGEVFENAMVTDLAVSPIDSRQCYVATRDGLFLTRDMGVSWQQVTGLPANASVRTIGINPHDPNTLIAGLPGQGLYLSQDGGTQWHLISAGLEPNGDHRDIVFDPLNIGVVYTSDIASGIYRSDDGGQTWLKISQGLTTRAATGLSLSTDGNHLYTATSGGGVFRLDLTGKPPVSTSLTLFEPSPESDRPVTEVEEMEPEGEQPVIPKDEEAKEEKEGRSLPCLGGTLPLLLSGIFSLAAMTRRRKQSL